MKLKLDENLPAQLTASLRALGHNVHTVQDEGLEGAYDSNIWRAAQADERVLLTQDLDFSDTRQFVPGTHQGIFLIRLESPSRLNLVRRIEEVFRREPVETWQRCFVVLTERKIRVRRATE
jgi:predicted nuclease of predicted toxin-antitoxin system